MIVATVCHNFALGRPLDVFAGRCFKRLLLALQVWRFFRAHSRRNETSDGKAQGHGLQMCHQAAGVQGPDTDTGVTLE